MTDTRIRLTLCFFEDPAARAEIDHWESVNHERIVSRRVKGRLLMYTIAAADSKTSSANGLEPQEFLVCIPFDALALSDFAPERVDETVREYSRIDAFSDTFSSLKFLVFGRIERSHLPLIERFMDFNWVEPEDESSPIRMEHTDPSTYRG